MWQTTVMIDRRTTLLSVAALTVSAIPAMAQSGPFEAFVTGVKAEARRAGIRDATLTAAFAGVTPNQHVIDLDRRQPDSTMTWSDFRTRFVTPLRRQQARDAFAKNRALLDRVQARYGVDAHTITGIWGFESGFGVNRGNYRLVESLSTLAWEGRRGPYFRKELMNVLRILDAGDVTPARLTGSYAGAMGQPQFMPSSYLAYAVDFEGSGKRDIWDSVPDVLASIANYLQHSGWRTGEPWGQPVRLPAGFNTRAAGRDNKRPLGEWAREGVTRNDGTPFGRSDVTGGVLLPDGGDPGEAYMVYSNFNVIRRYNASDFYALVVGLLGDAAA